MQRLTAPQRDLDSIPVQPLMVLVVVAILSAILLGIILRSTRARALGAAAVSGLATVLLISNQINVTNDLADQIASDTDNARILAADWVGSRVGFWLALGMLLLITAYHVAGVTVRRRAGCSLAVDQADQLAHPRCRILHRGNSRRLVAPTASLSCADRRRAYYCPRGSAGSNKAQVMRDPRQTRRHLFGPNSGRFVIFMDRAAKGENRRPARQ